MPLIRKLPNLVVQIYKVFFSFFVRLLEDQLILKYRNIYELES